MRKTLLLLLIFLLLGCNKLDNYETDYYKYVKNIIDNDKKITNMSFDGYKLYLPKGINIKKSLNNNMILSSEDTLMYLYVDIISYYYKKDIVIENEGYDYFREIDGNNGYLIVDENNGKYYINVGYNYSNIEFYCEKKDISKLLTFSSIILNNIDFNKSIIEKQINNSYNNSGEKIYEINDLKETDSNFSKYLNEYVEEVEEKEKLPD